jgi:hypothetical protein
MLTSKAAPDEKWATALQQRPNAAVASWGVAQPLPVSAIRGPGLKQAVRRWQAR